MSERLRRRKCRCCNKFFFPDYRNRDRQHYCGQPACCHASKRASQRRWSCKPANRDYFRGASEVARVQAWRQAHPGYWKRRPPRSGSTQAVAPQQVNPVQSSCNVPRSPLGTLQENCPTQDPAFIGLIALITGGTLQEDIVATARRVVERGQNILGLRPPEQRKQTPVPVYDRQTPVARGPAAASPARL